MQLYGSVRIDSGNCASLLTHMRKWNARGSVGLETTRWPFLRVRFPADRIPCGFRPSCCSVRINKQTVIYAEAHTKSERIERIQSLSFFLRLRRGDKHATILLHITYVCTTLTQITAQSFGSIASAFFLGCILIHRTRVPLYVKLNYNYAHTQSRHRQRSLA